MLMKFFFSIVRAIRYERGGPSPAYQETSNGNGNNYSTNGNETPNNNFQSGGGNTRTRPSPPPRRTICSLF